MQHDDLDKTKVLKTQKDFKSDVRKPKFQVCVEFCPTGQTGWTCPRASPVPLTGSRDVFWICPILDQICLMNHMTVGI
jgi:hypothetical protein